MGYSVSRSYSFHFHITTLLLPTSACSLHTASGSMETVGHKVSLQPTDLRQNKIRPPVRTTVLKALKSSSALHPPCKALCLNEHDTRSVYMQVSVYHRSSISVHV